MDSKANKPTTPEQAKPDTPSKTPDSEVQRRVDDVLQILLDGARYWDVLQLSADRKWNVKERQLREYMRRARDLVKSDAIKSRKKLIMWAVAKRERLYARAVQAGDFRAALAILDSLAKLQGLFPNEAQQLLREIRELREMVDEAEMRRFADSPANAKAEGPMPLKFDGAAVPACRPY